MANSPPNSKEPATSGSSGFSMSIQTISTKWPEKRPKFFEEEKKKKRRVDDEGEEEFDEVVKYMTSFDKNQTPSHKEGQEINPLVIPSLTLPNWTDRISTIAAQRHSLGKEPSNISKSESLNVVTPVSYGLMPKNSIRKNFLNTVHAPSDNHKPTDLFQDEIHNQEKMLRQLALEEIMKGSDKEDIQNERETDLILPQIENNYTQDKKVKDDDEAFRCMIDSYPDEAKINYERIPIQEFGAALLRGMGWKPGMSIGKNQTNKALKLYEPQHRPTHLGLGASVLPSSHLMEQSTKFQNVTSAVIPKRVEKVDRAQSNNPERGIDRTREDESKKDKTPNIGENSRQFRRTTHGDSNRRDHHSSRNYRYESPARSESRGKSDFSPNRKDESHRHRRSRDSHEKASDKPRTREEYKKEYHSRKDKRKE
ncbi:hypothetical protein G9A89_020335 [Geosiphon pyriformis]|nr:hypothetical protein G9A89_020335 [Geosiphon pyriformis]